MPNNSNRQLSKVELGEVKKLWEAVKKETTTENIKLIKAMDALDRYLY